MQPSGQVYLFAESDPGKAVWQLSAHDINGRPSGVARTATSLDVVALDPIRIATSDTAIANGAWRDPQYSDQEADSQPAKGVDLRAILRGARYLHLFVNHDDGTLTAGCDTSASVWTWSAWTEIKAPDGPHWQLVGKRPTLTRTGTVFRLIPNWFGLLFGRK